MNHLPKLTSTLLLASALTGQQFTETFSFPNGPAIPGWTARNNGTWSITNGRLTKTGGSSPDFLTKDGLSAKNCVLDVEVFYGTTNGVQHGGLVARHPGTNTTSPSLYCKVQDNGGTFDLDIVWLYEQGGSGAGSMAIAPAVQTATLRLVALDNTATVMVDANKDGVFEVVMPTRTLTTVLTAGFLGCSITSGCQLDNFKYYDGVLVEKTGSLPKIGTTYNMRFATPAAQSTPWIAAFALANSGIPLGSRALPLALDPLFNLTLGNLGAFGLVGLIDANGDGNPAFPIPNDPSLVGFGFYAAAVTIDPTMPVGVGVISEDLRVVIQA